ncbi:low temperature requirement protein A [Streptomyces sp. KL116D]|uniref:low temperature requirement protein A n=1 Tax=Streptomyces sp. KL116D TaxID=3045152 RepID=UPI003558A222
MALGIAVASGLWWVYFDGDESRADDEFERATEQRRQMLAYYAFTGAHLVMIIGVILVAAGITDVIHPLRPAGSPLVARQRHRGLPPGPCRLSGPLGSGRITDRALGAACAVPLAAMASRAGGWLGMVSIVLVLSAIAAADHRTVAQHREG